LFNLPTTELFLYTLQLADSTLLMGQRHSEWTGHGPVLEQDIAITNIALDYLGQSRNLYQYAASLYNNAPEMEKAAMDKYIPRLWKSFQRELQEDDLAFLREEQQFLNVLLTELPRGDWAFTVLKEFFYSAFLMHLYQDLLHSTDTQLAAIGEKSVKEVSYHLRWSSEWVIRLGDGTEESNTRLNNALADIWMFTGELFVPAPYEQVVAQQGVVKDPQTFKEPWLEKVSTIFQQALLDVPTPTWMQHGGKEGRHTEHMGYLLAEMQQLQRTYPNATW
jgi:ring-1,2-phenylacetyl-CoA epoxidase subunit PaaC